MAETSLSAYQDKIDSLLLEDKRDVAMAHARQVLAVYPLNLRAWQQLGDALMAQGQWTEAAAILRRLLGARPLEFKTHQQLAQVYQRLGQGERAIMHAERACDQRPNDADAEELLRQLFRDFVGADREGAHLSAAGLAQRVIRESKLEEAIALLDEALQSEPERIDLRLLRARALWLEGQRMAAAEAADEILRQLPHAIAANRILAELWLAERRPSDARPYLERIEALDPYLAHQLAGSGLPADDLITLEELDESSIDSDLDNGDAPQDLPDLLGEAEIETLFSQTIASHRPRAISVEAQAEAPAMEPVAEADDMSSLDDDLARMLEQLDSESDAGNSWLMDVQGSAAEPDDGAADWLDSEAATDDEADDEGSGAPWLSAAMREMQDDAENEFDLFAEDEQLRALLQQTSDTEPIQLDDIDAWLEETQALEDGDEATDADELLESTPGAWHDDAPEAEAQGSDADPNRRNVELIESWGSELDVDDDDDPYVDWLSDEAAAELDQEISAAATDDMPPQAAEADDSAAETARAWGLDEASQLADFVEQEVRLSDAEAPPGWLNAALPGMDREGDADPDNPEEFAGPMGRPGRDFAWLNDIVDEETGEMQAVNLPEAPADIPYFRFEKPPVWMIAMAAPLAPGAINKPMAASPAFMEQVNELDLDDLTFDDYFNINTPTDRMDAISLDEGVDGIDFAEMGWDDYFELESPTEKTIAINLDDEVGAGFRELRVDEADFDFDTPTEKMPAIRLNDEVNTQEFDDIGLDAAPSQRDPKAGKTTS